MINLRSLRLKGLQSEPHYFVNEKRLDYVGPHPVTGEPNWNLKESLKEYLLNDVNCLYEVLESA